MRNIKELFSELSSNFFEVNEDVEAIIVSDKDGLIIAGETREDIDMEIVSVLTSIINPVLERIRDEFAFKQFGTANFDTEDHRLMFITISKGNTVSLVIDPMASIDKVSPYAYFLAEKVERILNAQEDEVIQLNIPNFEYEAERAERLENQIYQMHLDSGGKYRFKFIIVGDHEVGKTSIVRRFVENKFSHDYRATIGLNILSHSIEFLGNEVKFSIWDIGAQKYFKRFRKTYYLGSQAAFIVFDLTNRESYENVLEWLEEISSFLEKKELPIIVIGNKSDLKEQRVISYQEGVQMASDISEKGYPNISYIETSALTGENIKDAFRLISYHYIKKSKEIEEKRLEEDILDEIDQLLPKNKPLKISFISKSQFWSPGLQILTSVLNDIEQKKHVKKKKKEIFKYVNGLELRNYTFESIHITGSDGVFCIFDARKKEQIPSEWKEIVVDIIEKLEERKVALIGIRVSSDAHWSNLLEEFDVNEYLEKKMISLLFFKIGDEYRFEIFDQLKVLFSSLQR